MTRLEELAARLRRCQRGSWSEARLGRPSGSYLLGALVLVSWLLIAAGNSVPPTLITAFYVVFIVVVMVVSCLRVANVLRAQRVQALPTTDPRVGRLLRQRRRLLAAAAGDGFAAGGMDGLNARLRLMMTDRDFDAEDYEALLNLDELAPPVVDNGASQGQVNRLPTYVYKGKEGPFAAGDATAASTTALAPAAASSGGGNGSGNGNGGVVEGGASTASAVGAGAGDAAGSAPASGADEHASDAEPDSPKEGHWCAVCLESFAPGDLIKIIPCFHQFHSDCIDPWLLQNGVCPVCKASAKR